MSPFSVSGEKGTLKWLKGRSRTGSFSIKSIYKSLCSQEPEKKTMKLIWQARVLLKIKSQRDFIPKRHRRHHLADVAREPNLKEN